jgi:hypothetical protein
MQADVLLGGLEQLRHVLLREPDGFVLEANVELKFSVLGLVDEELSAGGWIGGVDHDAVVSS